MKIFKKFVCLLLIFGLCSVNMNQVVVKAADLKNQSLLQPNWWPGNPNPQPGTEDWFFQNLTYGANATKLQAEGCVKSALIGAGFSISFLALATWVSAGTFTLAAFGSTFGTGLITSYGACLFEKNVPL